MAHNSGHSRSLDVGIAVAVVVGAHIFPIVGHIEIHIANRTASLCGVVVMLHDSGKGCADASYEAASGNKVVKRRFLAPGGCVKFLSGTCFGTCHNAPACASGCGGNLGSNSREHRGCCGRHIGRIITGIVGVTDYRRNLVIGGNDDKTTSVDSVEHIKHRHTCAVLGGMHKL